MPLAQYRRRVQPRFHARQTWTVRRVALAVVLIATAAGTVASAPRATAVVPAGFTDEVVATAIAAPTAFAFTPDGRILITTQPGRVRVVQNGALLPTPAFDRAAVICSTSERGLLGIASTPTSR
jgi:glucose/arabinose dehydrogenase